MGCCFSSCYSSVLVLLVFLCFSSCCSSVRENETLGHFFVTSALISSCLEEWVRLPTNQEALDSAHDTMQRTGFPGIWAALDGTHLPISAPADGYHDYTNRKGWQSLNMQALVNGNGRWDAFLTSYA